MKRAVLITAALTLSGLCTYATETVRETFDQMNTLGNIYPANQTVTNSASSLGFSATSPWISNPAEHANNTLISIRSFFPENFAFGLPPNYDGTTVAICEDNSFPNGPGGSLWSSGIWMTRKLQPGAWINFNTNGEYWLSLHVGMLFDAQYAGDIPASGAGGIGFADGTTTNAHYFSVGVTGTNVFLGPPDGTHPFGTIEATKSVYVSQGTLGQPSNPNSLLYNPQNDPNGFPGGTNYQGGPAILTNFTGGPYYVNAFSTNRMGQCQGDGIMILAHLVTHTGGNATIQAVFYNAANSDQMDLTTNTINWDCQYSFNYTGVMSNMLAFENGEFPLYIYDFRVGTTFADVAGMDSEVTVSPQPTPFTSSPFTFYAGLPINLTNNVGLANAASNPNLSLLANYGTITYQWQQNGTNIAGATTNYLNIPSASQTDGAMPSGSDAGTYTCIATDATGTWGSITSAPVVISVIVDTVPPFVASISPRSDLSTVVVTYSEQVTGADVAGHYALSGGLTVTNVTVQTINNQTVATLQTTAQPLATRVTVNISQVKDLAGNALTPSTVTFWSDMYSTGAVDYDAWISSSAGGTASYFSTVAPTAETPTPPPGFSGTFPSWDIGTVNVVPAGGGAPSSSTYGAKAYGWFIPPVTTNYVFFVSADDGARLSLSTNSLSTNLFVIAVEDLWSPNSSWTNYSNLFPTGDHRGSGTANNNPGSFGGVGGGWDAGPDQNRSDEFIAAYNDEIGGTWTSPIGFIASVVGNPSLMPFWPTVDSNGNALIHLQAGQQYYIQCDHQQGFGGAGVSVTYQFATNPGSRANDPATGSATLMRGNVIAAIVPFKPSLSIAGGPSGPTITFQGILASSTNVQGPYTDVTGATSPYAPTGGTKFFRTHE